MSLGTGNSTGMRWQAKLVCRRAKKKELTPIFPGIVSLAARYGDELAEALVRGQVAYGFEANDESPGWIMGLKPEQKECAAFLSIDYKSGGNTEKKPVGTCFFVVVYDDTVGTGHLVTAKHVYDEWIKDNKSYVRLNLATTTAGGVHYQLIDRKAKWHFHSDTRVDLAVLRFVPDRVESRFSFLEIESNAVTQKNFQDWQMPWPPEEHEEVLYIANVAHLTGSKKNFLLARHGHLVLVPDEPIRGHYGESDYYLIESQIYPGNSGSPVWLIDHVSPTSLSIMLLGVLCAGDEVKQEILSKRGNRKEPLAYYNLGIAYVTPVQKLIEILRSKETMDMRKDEENQPKPVPVVAQKPG